MADTVTEKLSDERLREFLSLLDGMKEEQPAMSPPSFVRAIIAELLSRRTAPAEPVAVVTQDMVEHAWVTYVDASMSPSITNHEAMRAVLEEAFARTRSALVSPTDEMVERAARMLADWIGYSWDGLREGRIGDRGFPQWAPSGNYQGGKQDLRDLAAALLAALGGHHD